MPWRRSPAARSSRAALARAWLVVRMSVEIEAGEIAELPLFDGDGSHGRVVGAKPEWRNEEVDFFSRRHRFQSGAQRAVRRDAAADREPLQPRLRNRLPTFSHQDIDDRLLKA